VDHQDHELVGVDPDEDLLFGGGDREEAGRQERAAQAGCEATVGNGDQRPAQRRGWVAVAVGVGVIGPVGVSLHGDASCAGGLGGCLGAKRVGIASDGLGITTKESVAWASSVTGNTYQAPLMAGSGGSPGRLSSRVAGSLPAPVTQL